MAETIHTNQFLTNFATTVPLGTVVGDFIAPTFKVKRPADKYLKYQKSINRVYENKVKDGEEAKEISWDVTEGTYSCEEYSLSKGVSDRKRENADKPIMLDKDATRFLKRLQAIAREYRVISIADSTTFVTNNAGDKSNAWATTSTATPITDIMTAMQSVSDNSGMEANRIVMTQKVAFAMIKTDEWKEYFKYTDSGFGNGLFNAISGLRQLGLEPRIVGSRGSTGYEAAGSDPTDGVMWGDDVLVFYAEPRPTTESLTFMYQPFTFMDIMETVRQTTKRRDLHIIKEEIDELLVATDCAYLIDNVI